MYSVDANTTAALIRQLRQRLQWSQSELALHLGVSLRSVNRWENGRATPSPMALRLINEKLQQIDRISRD
ncbi:MAG: helix-turn-helix domain-containing protein [Hydrococcus sp. Prado102]|jgi:DNA-binding transcriptional regulator YiaG|nr:helix-turn-helix domain-containing protein [Hydrococcus sp. Prado102]